MGRWAYDWEAVYYGRGCFIRRKVIAAKTRQEALSKLRETERVIEVVRCERIDRWG